MIELFKIVKQIRKKDGDLHFMRISIFSINKIGLFIHYFNRCDSEKHEHDHPWSFSTLVLSKGYIEQHRGKFFKRGFLSYKKFKSTHPHRIHKLLGKYCITLAYIHRREREWGYPTEYGWLDHKKYREYKHDGKL